MSTIIKTRVAVMFGGRSVEHEVSVISGIQAMMSMDTDKYEVIPVYITEALETNRLSPLAQRGIYAVYGEDYTIYYNEPDLKLTDLYDQEEVRYQAAYMGTSCND